MSKRQNVVAWVCQIVAAVIMGQTLFFKFTGAPESIYIFETLGAEPVGRFATAIAELVAVVLLLIPRTAAWGGVAGIALMLGAVFSHVTKLGIEVQGDGGTLFGLAVTTFVASSIVVLLRRDDLPIVGGGRD